MILDKIKLHGYLSYKTPQTLDLTNYSSVLISGQSNSNPRDSNGAGKSSLVESIGVCFFGVLASRAKTLDELINHDCDTASIEVTFRFENNTYKKVRTFGVKKHNELYIKINDKWESFGKNTEADKSLIKILGINPTTFFSILYLRQDAPLQFIEGTSSDRKEIFRELLQLQIYEEAHKKTNFYINQFTQEIDFNKKSIEKDKEKLKDKNAAVSLKKELTEDLDTIKYNIKILSNTLDKQEKIFLEKNKKIEKLKQQLEEKENLQKLLQELEETEKTNNSKINELITSAEDNLEKIQIKKEECEENSQKIQDFTKKIDSITIDKIISVDEQENLHKTLTKDKAKAYEKISAAQAVIETLNENLEKFNSSKGICPVLNIACSSIDKKSNSAFMSKIEKEIKTKENQIAELKESVRSYSHDIKQCELKLEEIESHNAKVKENEERVDSYLQKIKMLAEITKISESAIKSLEENIEQTKSFIEKIKQENAKISSEKRKTKIKLQSSKNITIDTSEIDEIKDKIDKTKSDIANEQKELNEVNKSIGEVDALLAQLEELEKEISDLAKKNKELNFEVSIYQKLSKTFGKNGIQKTIIKKTVPELERLANNLVKEFFPYKDIRINFDLDPINKSGSVKAQGGLDIIIIEKNIKKNFSLYSGGEKIKLTFSILLAMSELLSQRAGKQMQTLIIDERISNLDENGIDYFADIINTIKTKYKRLLVITHISQLKDLFNEMITINKTEENGSMIVD